MVKPSILAAGAVLASCMASAGAASLNFDDLPAGGGPFVAAYDGFTFGAGWTYSTAPSIYYGPHSGAGYAVADPSFFQGEYLEDGQPISRQQPFVFEGAWVTGINQVRYTLYYGDQVVFMSPESAELTWQVPMFIASGYDGPVTSVVIGGRQGFFAIDDFIYAPVPEPAVAQLLALGVLGLALGRRLKR